MKILLVSNSDTDGGAAVAAHRLLKALNFCGQSAKMLVAKKNSLNYKVIGPENKIKKLKYIIRPTIGAIIQRVLGYKNLTLSSGNWLDSSLVNYINNDDCDIVNLHWVNGETLSLRDISKIKKPVVFTLHDMWLFCASEHYVNENKYPAVNQTIKLKLYDSLVWKRKLKYLNFSFDVITPSDWLSDCAKNSSLLCNKKVTTIPNPLDRNIFFKHDKKLSRKLLSLDENVIYLGFGAVNAKSDQRKGWQYLNQAIQKLMIDYPNVKCVIFGASSSDTENIKYLGKINDEQTLSLMYNAIDLMVVPSEQEAFGQTASEAISCGTPVIAFRKTGLKDIVQHKKTGYLAEFNENPADSLYEGIIWCINNLNHINNFDSGNESKKWSYENVSTLYSNVYLEKLNNK